MLTGIDDMTAGLSGPPPSQQTPQMSAQTSQYLSVNISIEKNTADAYELSDQNTRMPVPDGVPVKSLVNINNFNGSIMQQQGINEIRFTFPLLGEQAFPPYSSIPPN